MKLTVWNIYLLRIFVVALFTNSLGYAQINTESLRKVNLANGFYNSVQFDFSSVSGNTEFVKLKGQLRTDYFSGLYYSFGVIQYQRGIQNNKVFTNKGFIHLRSIRRIAGIFNGEVFVQKEFNDFISLKDRNLIGGGTRFAIIVPDSILKKHESIRIDMGLGAMWENEKIDNDTTHETRIIRSTNYLSVLWKLTKRIDFNTVGYYQVDTGHIKDYRILVQSALEIFIIKSLSFKMTLNYRYDNEPPHDIKKYDLEINNGIRFSF